MPQVLKRSQVKYSPKILHSVYVYKQILRKQCLELFQSELHAPYFKLPIAIKPRCHLVSKGIKLADRIKVLAFFSLYQ